ncbi:MAG: N-acetylmuramoyl-L-alanine amidase [Bacteroidetes bacterium]|nr:N-acetylmuramoyl-L-alanine amidase [Bacteroidota bacterium]MBS1943162.1 N-acetylmuramoyl-L-alanine amidase [Bacteroidota bacterium]
MRRANSGWWLAAVFVLAFTATAMPQNSGKEANRVGVIVLDAGHGGKDPGNMGTKRYKTTEKDVALAITLLVGKYINEGMPDVKVIYTREDDRFIELMERDNIANRAKADVFLSIHCNANKSTDPHGCETYVMGLHKTEANMRVAMKENESILLEADHALKYDGYDPKDPESMIALSLRQNAYLDHSLLLSSLIQAQFKDRVGRVDRGVKQAGFLVISYTTMPAALIELGFLTNAEEEDFLQSTKGQEYMASAIYRAFKEYKDRIEHKDVNFSELEAKAKTPAKDSTTARSAGGKADEVRFKVQIVTSSKRIPTSSPKFKGLDVEEVQAGDLWKYSVGSEPDLDGARKVQDLCKSKGFEGSFITAWQGGKRIDLQQAVNLLRDP